MPVHILPGASDPAGTLLPQQPLPRAMFRGAAAYASFACETNPAYLRVASGAAAAEGKGKGKQKAAASSAHDASSPARTLLVSAGQPVEDMQRYMPALGPGAHTRLALACASLRWRHFAPTAPDTLWCHPYFGQDPFVLAETPDVYVVGCQPRFGTRVVEERGWGRRRGDGEGEGMEVDEGGEEEGVEVEMEEGEGEKGMEGEGGVKRCRVVLVPVFRTTGILVLLNLRTLAVRTVQFAVEGMNGGGEET